MKKEVNVKEITIPKRDERLAELVGIILGDGYIQYNTKKSQYSIRIAGDSNKDREYIINYVKPLCDSLFGLESTIRKHQIWNALYIIINRKKAVEFLLSIGMQAGDKIKNQATIPKWILENDCFLRVCIRGLIDTDGSVYELLPHWPGLWQICFTNKNEQLMKDFRESLIKLGIGCSKVYSKVNTPKMFITKKSEVGVN